MSQKVVSLFHVLACHEVAVDDETEALAVLDFALPLEQTVFFAFPRFAGKSKNKKQEREDKRLCVRCK